MTTTLTTHTHSLLHSVFSRSHFSFFFFFSLIFSFSIQPPFVPTLFLLLTPSLLLTHIASTHTHTHTHRHTPTQTQAAVAVAHAARSIVSSSLVRPGSLIKALNEAACIKHEAPRAAVMNCCSIIASQSRKMKTKYLKRDSVTSLQTQHQSQAFCGALWVSP